MIHVEVSEADRLRIRDEADDVRVLSTIVLKPVAWWHMRDIWESAPDLTMPRIYGALGRLTHRGEIRQGQDNAHWRLASTPLGEG